MSNSRKGHKVVALVGTLGLGYVIGTLFAPKSGSDTRATIASKVRRASKKSKEESEDDKK